MYMFLQMSHSPIIFGEKSRGYVKLVNRPSLQDLLTQTKETKAHLPVPVLHATSVVDIRLDQHNRPTKRKAAIRVSFRNCSISINNSNNNKNNNLDKSCLLITTAEYSL
jgi:hypothetical protein